MESVDDMWAKMMEEEGLQVAEAKKKGVSTILQGGVSSAGKRAKNRDKEKKKVKKSSRSKRGETDVSDEATQGKEEEEVRRG